MHAMMIMRLVPLVRAMANLCFQQARPLPVQQNTAATIWRNSALVRMLRYLPYYFHTSHNFQYFVLGVFCTSVNMSSFFQSPDHDMRHSIYFLFQTPNDYHIQPPALMPEPFLNPAMATLQTVLPKLVRKVSKLERKMSERDGDPIHCRGRLKMPLSLRTMMMVMASR